MPGWFESNIENYQANNGGGGNIADLGSYGEPGGFTGGIGGSTPPPVGPGGNIANAGGPLQDGPPQGGQQPFDPYAQVGHDGTFNGMNREQYRDAWMSSGVDSVAGMKDWIGKNGGKWLADNGTVMTPYGEALDMGGNARGSAAGNGKLRTAWGGGGGGPEMQGPQMDGGSMLGGGPGGGFSGGGPGGGYGGGGGGYGGGGRKYEGDPYTYNDIAAPTDYNPTATAGPQNYAPERVTAGQVDSPEALQHQQIANAEKFQAPTAADMAADPGMQVRLDRGSKAFMANKAASGVMRTGGALKGLADYNQDSASQEYGNVYNRKFGEYQTGLQDRLNVGNSNNQNAAQAYGLSNQFRQGAQIANQGANLQAGMANQGAGLQAWQAYQGMNQQNNQFNAGRQDQAAQQNFSNRFAVGQANNQGRLAGYQANANTALGYENVNLGYQNAQNSRDIGMGNIGLGYHQANQSYDLGLRNNALGYTQAGNSYALGQGNLGLGWANYGLNEQGQGFDQQYRMANMGMQAAGQYGNYAGQYGQNSAGNAMGAGNAQAAGRVGSANAWNQGMGGAFNAGMSAYGGYQQQQNGGPRGGLYLDPGN